MTTTVAGGDGDDARRQQQLYHYPSGAIESEDNSSRLEAYAMRASQKFFGGNGQHKGKGATASILHDPKLPVLAEEYDDMPPDDMMIEVPRSKSTVDHEESPLKDLEAANTPPTPLETLTSSQNAAAANSASSLSNYLLPLPPRHDAAWSIVYTVCTAAMFSAAFIIWLRTEVPHSPPRSSIGIADSIYAALDQSLGLLSLDVCLALGIAAAWVFLMTRFLRLVILSLVVGSPTLLLTMSIITLTQSYKGAWQGHAVQDYAMRWVAFGVLLMCGGWCVAAWSGRMHLRKAVDMIEQACVLLRTNLSLLGFYVAGLGVGLGFTLIWIRMFARIFLQQYRVVKGMASMARTLLTPRCCMGSTIIMVDGRFLCFCFSLDLGCSFWRATCSNCCDSIVNKIQSNASGCCFFSACFFLCRSGRVATRCHNDDRYHMLLISHLSPRPPASSHNATTLHLDCRIFMPLFHNGTHYKCGQPCRPVIGDNLLYPIRTSQPSFGGSTVLRLRRTRFRVHDALQSCTSLNEYYSHVVCCHIWLLWVDLWKPF